MLWLGMLAMLWLGKGMLAMLWLGIPFARFPPCAPQAAQTR
jgi:hypothetical protein